MTSVLNQQSSSPACGSRSYHGSSGDVQMHPLGSWLHECLQKGSSLTRASFSSSAEIGEVAVLRGNQLSVVFSDRHVPAQLMNFFTSILQVFAESFVIGVKSSLRVTERSDHGSSQGRQFDEHIGLVVGLGPMHAISQHQSSLSISVSNLNGESLATGQDIRRPVCILVDGILNQPDAAGQVDWQLLLDDGLEGCKDSDGS